MEMRRERAPKRPLIAPCRRGAAQAVRLAPRLPLLFSGGWGAVRSESVERRAVCQTIHAVRCRPARKGIAGTSRRRAKLIS